VTGDVGPVVPLNNCTDNVGHGTHVAGIAAALDNNVGVVGAAPGARIFALKVCDTDGCPTSDILEGLDYVASHYYEIDVVNLSLGMERPNWLVRWFVATDEIEEAITRLVNTYGVVVVVAAGNDHINAKDYTPARTPAAITVSAMADRNGRCGGGQIEDDIFASFSNYGSVVDLAAPGVAIDSTLPGSRYGALSGTSMAAPHVTGAVALYLSLHPSATPAQVDQYLKSSGTKAPTLLQQNTGLSCDGNGRGYFSSRLDVDNIREPLLYTGWGAPICPRDCEATTAR
jgi:subtilisin family serine protease